MTIPTKFECMGSTITVEIKRLKDDGQYKPRKQLILLSDDIGEEAQEQTFWHEWMHCALSHLDYKELDENEQFVEQMAQCLYQLQKSRVDKRK